MNANEPSETSANLPWSWSLHRHRPQTQHHSLQRLNGSHTYRPKIAFSAFLLQRQEHKTSEFIVTHNKALKKKENLYNDHTIIIAKMIITLIYLKDEPPSRYLTRSCSLSRDTAVTGDRWEELSEVDQHVTSLKQHAPLVAEQRESRQAVMCPWGGLGSAGSGSGRVSGCGWCAGRTPCLLARPVLRGFPSRPGCRGPWRSGWCSSQMCGLECWCCSHCWTTEKQKWTWALRSQLQMFPINNAARL